MLERTRLINTYIQANGYTRYLEIGVGNRIHFSEVVCPVKVSVDPNGLADFTGTSDQFFEQNKESFDLVFVDGLHLSEQVVKDVLHACDCLSENGVILIHDCTPQNEVMQYRKRMTQDWTGDVWRAVVQLAMSGIFDMKLICIETGMVVLRKRSKIYRVPPGKLNWAWYEKNFKTLFS